MSHHIERIVEVRLIVIVHVDVADPELVAGLVVSVGKSVTEIVASEITSNLESVPYVRSAIASAL